MPANRFDKQRSCRVFSGGFFTRRRGDAENRGKKALMRADASCCCP